jgi:hypothetical protein
MCLGVVCGVSPQERWLTVSVEAEEEEEEGDVLQMHEIPLGFCKAMAATLQRLNLAFVQPYYRLVNGRDFGSQSSDPKLSAAEFLGHVAGSLKRYQQQATADRKSGDSKLCRCDVNKWHQALAPEVHVLLDSVAGVLEGGDLERACRLLQEEWVSEEECAYEPHIMRRGVALYATEALLVCCHDISALKDGDGLMRPPLMRCLAALTDNERISCQHGRTWQQPPPSSAWRTRRFINAMLVKKAEADMMKFLDAYQSDQLSGWMDNDDKSAGNATFTNRANDDHNTAGAYTTNVQDKTLRFDDVRQGTGDLPVCCVGRATRGGEMCCSEGRCGG